MSKIQQTPHDATYEKEVTCVHGKRCVLPCAFEPDPDPVIYWTKHETHVCHYEDREFLQHENYTDRAFLSEEEILRGNASLLLRDVRVQDEGDYQCLTRNNGGLKETRIRARVTAPVGRVRLEPKDGRLFCECEGIYPKPNVTWTNNFGRLTDQQTSILRSESGLFSVNSSVPLTHCSKQGCSCIICKTDFWNRNAINNSWSKTLIKITDTRLSDIFEVACPKPIDPVKSRVYKFNNKYPIYNKTGSHQSFNDSWEPYIDELKPNSLVLKNLPQDKKGSFSCEVSTDHATHVAVTTSVVMGTATQVLWPVAVLMILMMMLMIILIPFVWRRLKRKRQNRNQANQAIQAIQTQP